MDCEDADHHLASVRTGRIVRRRRIERETRHDPTQTECVPDPSTPAIQESALKNTPAIKPIEPKIESPARRHQAAAGDDPANQQEGVVGRALR